MGVTGLWQVVQPCARPIKLETLNRKRLAVDASIWIYQFLKAVRDKEGNALRNSHVVGFFRRICKLLFFGIKPVFVFDGGAPILKRQTINSRKARREGRREDAARTAGKLLAVQMQRRAEEEERKAKEARAHPAEQEEQIPDDQLVYTEEILMTEKEKQQSRAFKKKDAYHLPALDMNLSEMGAPNDPRIMSHAELEEYARQFHTGEDINLYDFSKIDFNSSFFQSLPAADRYNILNAARLRSRLRMGYSKEQLDTMFPDRMAFSKFQIERVKERNELTQRLMNLNGMTGGEFINGTQRVAGERGKEYVLVKNDGVEGGWALGVVSNKNEGERNQPIDVEALDRQAMKDEGASEAEEDFEDVSLAQASQLPMQPLGKQYHLLMAEADEATTAAKTPPPPSVEIPEDPESLFLADEEAQHSDEEDAVFEDVLLQSEQDGDTDLQRAIAMSLEQDHMQDDDSKVTDSVVPKDSNAAILPLSGRSYAQMTNSRAQSSVVNKPFDNAFANTTARRLSPVRRRDAPAKTADASNGGFSGPLPFESLDLGGSFLRKKKKKVDAEGGFETSHEEEAQPLPPWFSGTDVRKGNSEQTAMDVRQMQSDDRQEPSNYGEALLRKQSDDGIIDVDATQTSTQATRDIVDVDASDGSSDVEMGEVRPITQSKQKVATSSTHMDEFATQVKANPPITQLDPSAAKQVPAGSSTDTSRKDASVHPSCSSSRERVSSQLNADEHEDEVEWSESDVGANGKQSPRESHNVPITKEASVSQPSSPEPEFEDVNIGSAYKNEGRSSSRAPAVDSSPAPASPYSRAPSEEVPDDEYSDPEDEDLMAQLAAEAEEHARFAASLNAAASKQSVEEYEKELRSLRNQQKKDRRDADEVTHIMITECQQLLQLFGLPYITAPMEAEAQCAELVHLGLVDGIVTDDSDIFLFGGTRVYKNMFNQAKYVECYLASDLEKEYGLTREKIIQFSHLLGSDYVEGLPGVGPVSALEIVSEFGDLAKFYAWWEDVQSGRRPPPSEVKQSGFQKKFRKTASKLFLPPNFPDERVNEAYSHPEVDHDTTPFQWGVPDLEALRSFLMATIGWSRERADEILVPVVRDMNKRDTEGTQANITRFFSGTAGTGTSRMRGLAGDHGRKRDGAAAPQTSADTDASAAAAASAAAPGGESFAPRRRVAHGGSKRMATALGKLQARVRAEKSGERQASDDEVSAAASTSATHASPAKRRKKDAPGARRKDTQFEDEEDDTSGTEQTDDEEAQQPPRKASRASKRQGAKR